MKLVIQNNINLDGEVEVVEEIRDVEVVEKGDVLYLTYQNEEKESVVLKISDKDCTMTRFSEPTSVMRFSDKGITTTRIATPVGIQILNVVTDTYQKEGEQVVIRYALQIPQTGQDLARYHLKIKWGSF
ncbi:MULTISPECIES: DUF1934 domain-containing protein [unclassified Streptococcus]|uniref:DUF1934 domain-containing protein n=1 Tax=unclassified Streptococcus TaxID=2608887 RepID=UPI001071A232|nr:MULTISPECIES: DUF1934 domain-containing protein [unclassified Streptococcus]MBF0787649.1 DUF1934 domain-containing protein [Streptococcus sp. 19428wC2_LYSM12]MCQ9212222.1 DUF1934 domain-containing protein [Streptococcus sp. B01]MCQ9213552.1 DUF1934 domain-containing protein [Streptococcus sp. O1]TFV05371.1 DUF1934 domain-containing protein [Streptococcus sp. LYSM12]